MKFSIGVDIGGTFTDVVVYDSEGHLNLFKVATTPTNLIEGVFDGISKAAKYYYLSMERFLRSTDALMQGTTVATNAILTATVAKTGLICTKGFRDILLLRTGGKSGEETMFKHYDYPEPYIPRYLTLGVEERINAKGEVVTTLNEDEIRAAIRRFKKWKVEAIAVCLLWSVVNPLHEKKVAEIIEEDWPGVYKSISHKVNPVLREYYRTSTTAMDASLKPIISQYAAELEKGLRKNGYTEEILLVNSNGGVMTIDELLEFPIYSVKSGPSEGPVAGLFLAEAEGSGNNVLVADMGGTSFDVSICTSGNIESTVVSTIGDFHYSNPSAEVNTIGAGGGSIAWLDSAGLIHVGPQSAGALPGPACYMQGGEEPTVTDANVILGYINPDYFLGGEMKIDAKLSESVIKEKIAEPMKMGVVEAANLIYSVVNQNMVAE